MRDKSCFVLVDLEADKLEIFGSVIAESPENVPKALGGGKHIKRFFWQGREVDVIRLDKSLFTGGIYQVGKIRFIIEEGKDYLDVQLVEGPYLNFVPALHDRK